jgi:hypothetical protein
MGLTSCRWITIAGTLARLADAVRNRHHAGCRVAVERAADRYTLICDEPLNAASSVRGLRVCLLAQGAFAISGEVHNRYRAG